MYSQGQDTAIGAGERIRSVSDLYRQRKVYAHDQTRCTFLGRLRVTVAAESDVHS